MRHAADTLSALGVEHEVKIVSAHRTPKRLYDYAASAKERGLKLIIAGAGGAAAGRAVFESNGCGGCHAFEPAGSAGTVGPALDDLEARAEAVGQPLEEFVRESIVDPDDVVAPGFQANVMPKTYGQLPEAQVDALVQYLTGAENEEG